MYSVTYEYFPVYEIKDPSFLQVKSCRCYMTKASIDAAVLRYLVTGTCRTRYPGYDFMLSYRTCFVVHYNKCQPDELVNCVN